MKEKTIIAVGLPQLDTEGVIHKKNPTEIYESSDLILVNIHSITVEQCTSLVAKNNTTIWGVLLEKITDSLSKKLFLLPPLTNYVLLSEAQSHIEQQLQGSANKRVKQLEEELTKARKELTYKDNELKALDEAMRSLSTMTQSSDVDSAQIAELEQQIEQKEFRITEWENKNTALLSQLASLKEDLANSKEETQHAAQNLQTLKISIRQLEDECEKLRLECEKEREKVATSLKKAFFGTSFLFP